MIVVRQGYQPEGLMKRVVDGNLLYSHVLSISGGQRQIFVSGQVSRDVHGTTVGVADMAAQIAQAGEKIRVCLEAAGATLADLARTTTTYKTDIVEFFRHTDVRMRYFGAALPASTTVEIRRLALPESLVEIDATAIIG